MAVYAEHFAENPYRPVLHGTGLPQWCNGGFVAKYMGDGTPKLMDTMRSARFALGNGR
jgi:hypothetical protein